MSKGQHVPRRWEYQMIKADSDHLNDAGAQSWDVVATFPGRDTEAAMILMKRRGLSFQEQVTMEQRRRYFAAWGIDIDAHDQDHLT